MLAWDVSRNIGQDLTPLNRIGFNTGTTVVAFSAGNRYGAAATNSKRSSGM